MEYLLVALRAYLGSAREANHFVLLVSSVNRAVPLRCCLDSGTILHLPELHAQGREVQNQPREEGGYHRDSRDEKHALENDCRHLLFTTPFSLTLQ